MPVSSKRKKPAKKQTVDKSAKLKLVSDYIDDFLDNVIMSLENDNSVLISVLKEIKGNPGSPAGFKHYYVLSRNDEGKLLEHNEGPAFKEEFIKAVRENSKGEENPVKIVVGYFDKEQIIIRDGGLEFRTPNHALQWTVANNQFLPDESEYIWNGYEVQPGGHVSRTF